MWKQTGKKYSSLISLNNLTDNELWSANMGVKRERGNGEAAEQILEIGIRSGKKYTGAHGQRRTEQR